MVTNTAERPTLFLLTLEDSELFTLTRETRQPPSSSVQSAATEVSVTVSVIVSDEAGLPRSVVASQVADCAVVVHHNLHILPFLFACASSTCQHCLITNRFSKEKKQSLSHRSTVVHSPPPVVTASLWHDHRGNTALLFFQTTTSQQPADTTINHFLCSEASFVL